MYLRTLVSNTISVSDDVRSFNNNSPSVTSGTGIANPLETLQCAPVYQLKIRRYYKGKKRGNSIEFRKKKVKSNLVPEIMY
jgi:hypothetical protein